jgi:hypothetical protein
VEHAAEVEVRRRHEHHVRRLAVFGAVDRQQGLGPRRLAPGEYAIVECQFQSKRARKQL